MMTVETTTRTKAHRKTVRRKKTKTTTKSRMYPRERQAAFFIACRNKSSIYISMSVPQTVHPMPKSCPWIWSWRVLSCLQMVVPGPGEHPLQYNYTFWYSRRTPGRPASTQSYEQNIKQIGSFASVCPYSEIWSYVVTTHLVLSLLMQPHVDSYHS